MPRTIPRTAAALLLALAVAAAARAGEASTPELSKIQERSRLTFRLGPPPTKPAEEMRCAPRQANLRLVRTAEGASLVLWEPSEH